MPFEISPKIEAPAKVGRFKHLADAMLRGCAQTKPALFLLYKESVFPWVKPKACAIGALGLGLGSDMDGQFWLSPELAEMRAAYFHRYSVHPEVDNDWRGVPREQIAARIAAL